MGSLKLKFIEFERISDWRAGIVGQRVVATNGCFDVIHAGHISLLESAKGFGDILIVGINSDASVKALKGDHRPLNSELDRATVIASIWAVDAVTIFSDVRAYGFLKACRPDVWVKGGDYTPQTLDPRERAVVPSVILVPLVDGHSTTAMIAKMHT